MLYLYHPVTHIMLFQQSMFPQLSYLQVMVWLGLTLDYLSSYMIYILSLLAKNVFPVYFNVFHHIRADTF